MDYKKKLKELHEFLDSPAGKKSIEKFRKTMELEDERRRKMWNFIESLTDEEFNNKLDQLLKWEDAFEEREYQKGKEKSSNIFNTLFRTISDNCGSEYRAEMFCNGVSSYRGYEFVLYVGQGSFYTIEKGGERIFTSN